MDVTCCRCANGLGRGPVGLLAVHVAAAVDRDDFAFALQFVEPEDDVVHVRCGALRDLAIGEGGSAGSHGLVDLVRDFRDVV
jgi:hypothetical protein